MEEQHRIYPREGDGYPSGLRDAEWTRLEPMILPARPGGRQGKTDMRAAMNAILYLLRTGCPWRYLPRDGFPPRSTVYSIFRKFQREGGSDAVWRPASHYPPTGCSRRRTGGLAVFAVSAGNYQRALTSPPRKTWRIRDPAKPKTAGSRAPARYRPAKTASPDAHCVGPRCANST
jgi:transposase